jgi:hypothetical protein
MVATPRWPQDASQHLLPSAWILEPRMLLKWALHTKYVRAMLSIIVTPPTVSIERKSPMSEAAERVEAWRRDKRKAGYRPVLLWLPIETKSDLDALAYTRHQDIASCVVDAVRALATSQGTRKSLRLDAQQLAKLKVELTADILAQLAGQEVPVPIPRATVPAEAPPPAAPLPAGMKHCKQGHAYPATRAECPHCARVRKRRHRQLKAQKRTG